ncbi:MAG: MliC family protein [Halanaerobiales bacterium]
MHKKKILTIIIIIIALGIFSWLYLFNPKISNKGDDNAFVFICPSGREIKIIYHDESDAATLFINEDEYKIYPVISASGARYANDTETVIFWEHQGEAMVEINGETIYRKCKLKE